MIKVLDKFVADKIAAGEVIERPVSAVKELLENSIDAGASQIIVEIRKGGKSYIRVTDDGCGIAADEAETAFLRHATSKISGITDLDNIVSLGFRGEALASIAAVSKITLVTRTEDNAAGTRLMLHGGKVISHETAGANKGTTILVEDIFYNTPARRKFMKSDAREASAIIGLVQEYAICYSGIRFMMINNGTAAFSTRGDGDTLTAITDIYSDNDHSRLIAVNAGDVRGYISDPGVTRNTRRGQLFFVNGRLVSSPVIEKGLEKGYGGRVFSGYPIAILFIEADPHELDVNIHPGKREIRFLHQDEVIDKISKAVSAALESRFAVPKAELPKAELPEAVKPDASASEPLTSTHNASPHNASAHGLSAHGTSADGVSAHNAYAQNTSAREASSSAASSESAGTVSLPENAEYLSEKNRDAITGKRVQYDIDAKSSAGTDTRNASAATSHGKTAKGGNPRKDEIAEQSSIREYLSRLERKEKPEKPADTYASRSESESISEQLQNETGTAPELLQHEAGSTPELPQHEAAAKRFDFSELEYKGYVFDTYIIMQARDQLYIFDQHAAHERIFYEKLTDRYRSADQPPQPILTPFTINVSPDIYHKDRGWLEILVRIGYDISDFGANSFIIRGIPSYMSMTEAERFASSFCEDNDAGSDNSIVIDKLIMRSCKSAVKGGDRLSVMEINDLIRELSACRNPYACPHGRPTFIRVGKYDIERSFRRK